MSKAKHCSRSRDSGKIKRTQFCLKLTFYWERLTPLTPSNPCCFLALIPIIPTHCFSSSASGRCSLLADSQSSASVAPFRNIPQNGISQICSFQDRIQVCGWLLWATSKESRLRWALTQTGWAIQTRVLSPLPLRLMGWKESQTVPHEQEWKNFSSLNEEINKRVN